MQKKIEFMTPDVCRMLKTSESYTSGYAKRHKIPKRLVKLSGGWQGTSNVYFWTQEDVDQFSIFTLLNTNNEKKFLKKWKLLGPGARAKLFQLLEETTPDN